MNYFYIVIIIFFIMLSVYMYRQINQSSSSGSSSSGIGTNVLVPNPNSFLTWEQSSTPNTAQNWSSGPSFKSSSDIQATVNQDNSISFASSDASIISTIQIQLKGMRYYFSTVDTPMTVGFLIQALKDDPSSSPKLMIIADGIQTPSSNDVRQSQSFDANNIFTIKSDETLTLSVKNTGCANGTGCYTHDSFVVFKLIITNVTAPS